MIPVPTPQVPAVWPSALEALAPTIDMGGEHTPESVYTEIMEGRMVLWRNDAAWAVTTWRDFPRGRTAYVFVGGKDPATWIVDAQAVWMQWARDMKCTQIRMFGRRGWQRLIPDAESAVMLRRKL